MLSVQQVLAFWIYPPCKTLGGHQRGNNVFNSEKCSGLVRLLGHQEICLDTKVQHAAAGIDVVAHVVPPGALIGPGKS